VSAAAQTLAVYREGIKQKLTKAGNSFKGLQATLELQSLAKQAQAATRQKNVPKLWQNKQGRRFKRSMNNSKTNLWLNNLKEGQIGQVKERAQTIG